MSKTLEPKALDTAITPLPSLATISEAMASGPEVPMAHTVSPMSVSLMPSMQPAFSAQEIMKKTSTPSHTIDESIVSG